MSKDLRMPEINTVAVAGNLTRDPKVHDTSAGSVIEFTLAVSRRRKGVETTAFIGVVAWRDLATFCVTNLHKGDPVYVEGRLTQDFWEDKKTGAKRSKTKVTAHRVERLSWPAETGGDTKPETQEIEAQDDIPDEEEDPF